MSDRVIVVGAGAGIGRAVARDFASDGARVAVLGRTGATVRETAESIGSPDSCRWWAVDVLDHDQVSDTIAAATQWLGGLDVAVNSAGVFGPTGPVADLDPQAWREAVEINLVGIFHCLAAEARAMRGSGGGSIVNVSSTLGDHARPAGLSAYVSSKAGLSALTRVAARDHIGDGIRINAVSPGPIDTPMSIRPGESRDDRDRRLATTNPSGRVGSLDEVVAAIRYLASAEAGYHVGTDLVIDGGATA